MTSLIGCALRLGRPPCGMALPFRYELSTSFGEAAPRAGRQDARAPSLFNPVCDEHVRVAAHLRVAIGSEDELLPVGREHRETIKRVVESDALQARAINVDFVEIEIATFGIGQVGSEDYSLAVRKK